MVAEEEWSWSISPNTQTPEPNVSSPYLTTGNDMIRFKYDIDTTPHYKTN